MGMGYGLWVMGYGLWVMGYGLGLGSGLGTVRVRAMQSASKRVANMSAEMTSAHI